MLFVMVGINSLDQVKKIISYGVEKISISSNIKDTKLISEISKVIDLNQM